MPDFNLASDYKPAGDQPNAIKKLTDGVASGRKFQTLLGVTGSGKTFTLANVIQNVQKPTLVMSHNKTLAAQLCSEFRAFFPNNAVEYFVSYYDYYQPEAYVPQTDMYIEKDADINEEIDRLRHSATAALLSRRDVIVVASVSCIYGLGSPDFYKSITLNVKKGMEMSRETLIERLIEMQYERNDTALSRGKFRARGDVVDIYPSGEDVIIRIELFGDVIDKVSYVNIVTGTRIKEGESKGGNHGNYGKSGNADVSGIGIFIPPASHFAMPKNLVDRALETIEEELKARLADLRRRNRLLEAQRLEQRTKFDLEMIRETGYCKSIENYSRHFDGRAPGQAPYTLMDYFPKDYLLMMDESHVTLPQIHGMHGGDRSRKDMLIEYGFRLPSAYDNRPLKFHEFEKKLNQVIFTSATPGPYELEKCGAAAGEGGKKATYTSKIDSEAVIEQIIRPTGLVDPEVVVRPVKGQVDDLIGEIKKRVEQKERVLVTTLTKKMAEDLTEYLANIDIKVRYLHSDVDTIKRIEILRDLRLGKFDVLIGINLLREGLDLPEVSLVAILDADNEGFLRSETSLIQTTGRAARHVHGQVIMYADDITDSMERAIGETNRRRKLQMEFNAAHGITPLSIIKQVRDIIDAGGGKGLRTVIESEKKSVTPDNINRIIANLEEEMRYYAEQLQFEQAGMIRDKIKEIKKEYAEFTTHALTRYAELRSKAKELRKEFDAATGSVSTGKGGTQKPRPGRKGRRRGGK